MKERCRMDNNSVKNAMDELLSGLDAFVSSKTTVGEPIQINDKIIIPLMDIKIGVGAGNLKGKSDGTAGGVGCSMKPSSLIIIEKNNTRLVRIQNDDTLVKCLDMLPEVVGRVKEKFAKKDPDVEAKIQEYQDEAKLK